GSASAPEDVDNDGEPELVFALPQLQARWVRIAVDPATGAVEVLDQTLLERTDASAQVVPITALPNLPANNPGLAFNDFEPVGLDGGPLALDAFGAKFGDLVVAPSGDVWMADENRPSIYRFASTGQLIERFVPEGASDAAGGADLGTESIPPVYSRRVDESGFSGLALDEDSGLLYAFVRAPLDNPDTPEDATGLTSRTVRVLGLNPNTGAQVSQHAFLLDPEMRVADATWSGEEGVFLILEHNATAGDGARLEISRLDLSAGTNLLETILPGQITQFLEVADRAAAVPVGFEFVPKSLVSDLAARGIRQFEAVEGLARVDDDRLALITNDGAGLGTVTPNLSNGTFSGVLAAASESAVVLVELQAAGFDPSDADGGAQFDTWPVLGLYQPDALVVFEADGEFLIATADEGDARDYDGFSEEVRLGDIDVDGQGVEFDPYPLDPATFDVGLLEQDSALGRLKVTTVDGDLDDDGDYDAIHAFGGRGFSIRNAFGEVIYDSGDELARWTLLLDPDFYNANKAADATDERSDDKGVEPEGLAVGLVDGRTLLFVGCERSNAVFVYDVSAPRSPRTGASARRPGRPPGPRAPRPCRPSARRWRRRPCWRCRSRG
ncbi:MAG: esterase-like activity of phytase family protein, partial [Planctomycetota bacterium]